MRVLKKLPTFPKYYSFFIHDALKTVKKGILNSKYHLSCYWRWKKILIIFNHLLKPHLNSSSFESILLEWESVTRNIDKKHQVKLEGRKIVRKIFLTFNIALAKNFESKIFFVPNHLMLADFFMFTKFYESIIEIIDDQKS